MLLLALTVVVPLPSVETVSLPLELLRLTVALVVVVEIDSLMLVLLSLTVVLVVIKPLLRHASGRHVRSHDEKFFWRASRANRLRRKGRNRWHTRVNHCAHKPRRLQKHCGRR